MTDDQILFQDQTGVEGTSEELDNFARSLATGDFNNDGNDDLAVGVPGESIGNLERAGAVNVFPGFGLGLNTNNDQIWFQSQTGIEGTSEEFDLFGSSVAAGDFDGDNYDDLAVGVPLEAINGQNGGAVNLIKGSANGLTGDDDQIWFQSQTGVEGTTETGDTFGSSLTAGDFDGDGFDDLAIGAEFEAINGQIGGAVNVIRGSAKGLTGDDDQIWFQDQPGVEGTTETNDTFGSSLTAGDFNGDGFDDLAIGAEFEAIGSKEGAGAVNILNGSASGLTADDDQIWFQDQPGVEEQSEFFEQFGASLAAGDFNGDGFDDLAVGTSFETLEDGREGVVNVFSGSANGLTSDEDLLLFQDAPGVEGTSELNDFFGSSLSVGDFNNDGFDDLAIGVPGETIGSIDSAGAANIIFGSANGLTA